ncbi:MAG: alginate lyase family protein [candidate division KSB1 bacterium]|nr:alginate lyase family protein [candidate division KSB1 bacterium]MDZ7410639.1 alginate lyase family protein [candidate division KSB1 bacterium]
MTQSLQHDASLPGAVAESPFAGHSTVNSGFPPARLARAGIWTSSAELALLPMQGPAWNNLLAVASQPAGTPDLSNQDDPVNVRIMAKALVYARTGEARLRTEVITACMTAIGTEQGGRTLALGRELAAYVIAADLVKLPPAEDQRFRTWLAQTLTENLSGKTLRSTHEERPNNWGTHAGASRAAVAAYLGDQAELERCARVFKGWLGDQQAYAGFIFGDPAWQADPSQPVGINPKGARKNGKPVDGVLPDDQRRSGDFRWPPPQENYVYEALQGALVQAVILHRAGYDVWNWQDQALLRAYQWLHQQANFAASGDDTWQPHVINYYYGTHFPAPTPANPGKNVGWTDWTHGRVPQAATAVAARRALPPRAFVLEQNYPNPFTAAVRATQISYEVETPATVCVAIFNVMGQHLRTLFSGKVPPGRYTVAWDGRDQDGSAAPNGLYVYRLQAGSQTLAKTLLLVR